MIINQAYKCSFPVRYWMPSPRPLRNHSLAKTVFFTVMADMDDRAEVKVLPALENRRSTETDAAGMGRMSRAMSETIGKRCPLL